jgi:hypothetical protein
VPIAPSITMIRWPSAAVSSSVQSGRRFGSQALTSVPSVAEGVLNSAERGGYRSDPDPLQRLSTTKVYVVTRRLDAQLNPTRLTIAVPLSASSRIFSATS